MRQVVVSVTGEGVCRQFPEGALFKLWRVSMRKSKWVLQALTHKDKSALTFDAVKSLYDAAKERYKAVEDDDATIIFEKILELGSYTVKNEMSDEFREIMARSNYMLADIIHRSAGDDYEAVQLLDKALEFSSNFEEASTLKQSLEIENFFFEYRESDVSNKQ